MVFTWFHSRHSAKFFPLSGVQGKMRVFQWIFQKRFTRYHIVEHQLHELFPAAEHNLIVALKPEWYYSP